MAKRGIERDIIVDDSPPKRQKFNKFADENLNRKREIFYNICADTEFILSDNRSIKMNKAILCYAADSDVMLQMLFGPLKDDVTTISDIDSFTFKLFIDCLMKLEPYTFDTALKIFPVAWKYQVEKCIQKCIDVIEPMEVNQKACEILNMASFLDCKKLAEKVTNFIFKHYGSYKFIENNELFFALEPDAVFKILFRVEYIDSYMINNLLQWGENYLTTRNTTYKSITDLFVKSGIADFIDLDFFESASSLFQFSVTSLGKGLFTNENYASHLESSNQTVFLRSKWKEIKGGNSFTEEVKVKLIDDDGKNLSHGYSLEINPVVFCDLSSYSKGNNVISTEITVTGVKLPTDTVRGIKINFKCDDDRSFYFHMGTKHLFSCKRQSFEKSLRFTVKIKYLFHFDCRILLANSKEMNMSDPKLLFTKNITCQKVQ